MNILVILDEMPKSWDFRQSKAVSSFADPSSLQISLLSLTSHKGTYPPNCSLINSDHYYDKNEFERIKNLNLGLIPEWMVNSYIIAKQISKKLSSQNFDVAEVSPNANLAFFLLPAFDEDNVSVKSFEIGEVSKEEYARQAFDQLREDWIEATYINKKPSFKEFSYFLYSKIKNQIEAATNSPGNSQHFLPSLYSKLSQLPEHNSEEIAQKLQFLWDVNSGCRFDRVTVWSEIARLERLRGQLSHYCVYNLRIFRYLGRVLNTTIPELQELLRLSKFSAEASILERMFIEQGPINFDQSYSTHESSISHLMKLPNYEFDLRHDFRKNLLPKVSVIVSMYNADKKIENFLRWIKEQTINKQKLLEIVIVDSCSPGNEFEIIQKLEKELDLSLLYIRSKNRETIQTAWNQGISQSSAPYLCFLGVDETVRPDALEILAAKLDADPTVDWIIGSTVAYEINWAGEIQRPTMIYDRTDFEYDKLFMDNTQLSYVGALYRRSIHTRFGFYDGTFTAAGDTEFKDRVFSKIKAAAIPDALGFYMNYPEERMTEHPRAEIEDLRAYYWYRTAAGVNFSFKNRAVEDLEAQLLRTLTGFKKTYNKNVFIDIDYAHSILEVLKLRSPSSAYLPLFPGVQKIRDAYRSFEYLNPFIPGSLDQIVASVENSIKEVQSEHTSILNRIIGDCSLPYAIENDNRFRHYDSPWRHSDNQFLNIRNGKLIWV